MSVSPSQLVSPQSAIIITITIISNIPTRITTSIIAIISTTITTSIIAIIATIIITINIIIAIINTIITKIITTGKYRNIEKYKEKN